MNQKFVKIAVVCVLALAAVPTVRFYKRMRLRYWAWTENRGDYAGSLDRVSPPYDPTKPPSGPWLDPERISQPLAKHQTYSARTILGAETYHLLYLPRGYSDPANSARRYPVIYWLHGYAALPQHGTPFVERLDAAIKNGHCPPIIAVLPNGLYDSWYVDSVDGSQPVESIIIHDLIPHIDATWRTIADRKHRAIEGFSMGAWGAAHLAFKYSDLFCAATLISAPLRAHTGFPQFGRIFSNSAEAYYAEDPITRVHRNAATLKDLVKVRIFIGEEDRNTNIARGFDQRLGDWNLSHELTVIPGVGHSDGDVYEKLGDKPFEFYKTLFEMPANSPIR